MNILPLIIGFIIVFSCLSINFFKEAQIISIAERSIDAAFRIENQLHNRLELRQYLQKANVRNRNSKAKNKAQHPYYSLRAITPPIEESKLNISVLFDEATIDVHQHPIYPIAAELIRTLYEGSCLIPEATARGWEKVMLDAMIAKGKGLPEREKLTDLFPDDPSLQATYYKMLKGTNQYRLGNGNKGIAPLGNFLSVDPEKKEKTIHFCFASIPLLEAVFGKKISGEILSKEKSEREATGKIYFSSKEDLQEQLLQDPLAANLLVQLEPYFSFHKQLPRKRQIAGKDATTGLVITREIL